MNEIVTWVVLCAGLLVCASLYGLVLWEWARCVIEERKHRPVFKWLRENYNSNWYGPQILVIVFSPIIAAIVAVAWFIFLPVVIGVGVVWYLREKEREKKRAAAAS